MKAVAYQTNAELQDIELPIPNVSGRDILVEVKAISVNPVDYKIKRYVTVEQGQWKVLGWDAAGIIKAVGEQVENFKVGDKVYYAGDLTRSGSNAEYQLVDARIVGHQPENLDFAQSAAMPLTTITAWEMLFERLKVQDEIAGAAPIILIIGAAGGVGSIAIQLLKAKTKLTVIATASRPETQTWVKQLGADYVIDHRLPLTEQIAALNIGQPAFVFSITNTESYLTQIADLIAPQGRVGFIDDPAQLDIMIFKKKSVSVHWEMMFTRPIFQTEDMQQQGNLLNEVAALVEHGQVKSTLTQVYGKINAKNLKSIHAILEKGQAKGKYVLEGF